MFVLQIKLLAIKNGKREGITEFTHRFNPFLAACILFCENKIKLIKKIQNIIVKKYFLKENTKKLNFKSITYKKICL